MNRFTQKMNIVIALMLMSLLAVVPFAQAQDATAVPDVTPTLEPEMNMDAYVRVAHFAPNASDVSVTVDGEPLDTEEATYPTVTSWIAVEPGTHSLSIMDATTSDVIQQMDTFEVTPGFTTVAVLEDMDGQPTVTTFSRQMFDLLPGTSGITFVNALSSDTPVTFTRDDVPFVADLMGPSSRAFFIPVDADTFSFAAMSQGENMATLGEATEIDVTDGSYYLIAVVGTEENPELVVVETTGADYAMAMGTLMEPGTINEAILSREDLSGYGPVFDNLGLTETLSSEGEYTVLLPAGFLIDEIEGMGADATQTLQNHILDGAYTLSQILDMESVTTLAGNTYDVTVVDGNIFIGDAQVIDVNIFGTNGVVHLIDSILPLGQ